MDPTSSNSQDFTPLENVQTAVFMSQDMRLLSILETSLANLREPFLTPSELQKGLCLK